MGILLIPLLLIVVPIIDKINLAITDKQTKKYHDEQRRRGLMK